MSLRAKSIKAYPICFRHASDRFLVCALGAGRHRCADDKCKLAPGLLGGGRCASCDAECQGPTYMVVLQVHRSVSQAVQRNARWTQDDTKRGMALGAPLDRFATCAAVAH